MNNGMGSREGAKTRRDVEALATIVVDCALNLHKDLGPGLLESVYEAVLANMLQQRGLSVERQKSVPICYQVSHPSRLRVHQTEAPHV